MSITEGALLNGRLRYQQFATGHRSGFEPVLLAAAVAAQAGDFVLEAGTGAGAALLCLSARLPGIRGVGVEIDQATSRLAEENFKINGFDVEVVNGDIRHLPFHQSFDHVMANPPWHNAKGTASPDDKRALAHHALPGLLSDWIGALSVMLKPRGSIALIIPAAQFAEAAASLRSGHCGDIALFPLWPRAGQAAKQVIVTARRNARGGDRIWSGLILHDESGLTAAAEAVLREGAALTLA